MCTNTRKVIVRVCVFIVCVSFNNCNVQKSQYLVRLGMVPLQGVNPLDKAKNIENLGALAKN